MAEYSAHNVREEVKTRWGVDISYLKAWRTREKAIFIRKGYARRILSEVTIVVIHVGAEESRDSYGVCERWR